MHIKNILADGELPEDSVVKNFLTTDTEQIYVDVIGKNRLLC
jgi:hypothetical protein